MISIFNRQLFKIAAAFFLGLMAVFLIGLFLRVFIAINVTPSLPEWGWMRWPIISSEAADYQLGDRVEFKPPIDSGPINSVKIIKGIPGQKITVDDERNIYIDGKIIGKAIEATSTGKPLTPIKAGIIPQGYFFMAATHERSFDSRYDAIGLIPHHSITARVYPLPNIPWLGLDGAFFTEDEWQEKMKEAKK
jgi:conjugal transfer pilin signal peptidase TrbI